MQIPSNSVLSSLSENKRVSASGNALPGNGNEAQQYPPAFRTTNEQDTSDVYDFTNMSRREYNQLVKAGEVPLGYIALPTEGIDLTSNTKAQMEAVQDEKINFIDYYQNRIAYRESTGQSTENFRDVLADLQKLQGKAIDPVFTKSVDTYA
ncbi:hypothetical protein [Paraglaciecola sp. 20A4]|uniref:hypothetical protein n=1 Tax=Paraglaciecola sp. 20A4 TaxID=2687288 RepID=UPI001407E2DF|nr:hypothetical protein [Paraglaciecola sp. 20A4]